MGKITYKSLFTLVNNLIQTKNKHFTGSGYSNQLTRGSVAPLTSSSFSDISSSELLVGVQTLLKEISGSQIISGLTVTQTNPISDSVIVNLGKCSAGGQLFELTSSTTIRIPLNDYISVFYVNIYLNGIEIEPSQHPDKVSIAKIVVPKPGTTNRIKNNKIDSYPIDAYIVNFQEYKLYGDANGNLEEDSIEVLRDALRYTLSKNLIGDIIISENLKVLNIQGSVEMNSDSILIKDTNSNTMAKFNRKGTFFYDTEGRELAKFSVDEARVGNIVITKNSIESGNFVSGALGSGFKIEDSGDAEFNNVSVRGKIASTVFEKDTLSVVGGNLLIMDGDKLDLDMTALDTSTLTISGDTTFAVGDLLRMKDGINDEWLEVTNIASAPTYSVLRDKKADYTFNNNPIWKKGTSVTNFGSSGDGGIFMTASESNAPYISIVTHAGEPWNTLTTHLRLGNLNGFLDYSTDLYGIAIGTIDDYLKYDPSNGLVIKGSITVTGGSWSHPSDGTKIDGGDIYTNSIIADSLNVSQLSAITADMGSLTAGTVTGATLQTSASGSRIVMNADSITAYDDSSNVIFFVDTTTNPGDVKIGNYAGNKGLFWDDSAEIFTVLGTLNIGTAGKVYIDGTNEIIKVYDASNNLRLELGKFS